MRCDECMWWNQNSVTKVDDEGQCRRYPPVLEGRNSRFVIVTPSHCWCGEFQAKTVSPVARIVQMDETQYDSICTAIAASAKSEERAACAAIADSYEGYPRDGLYPVHKAIGDAIRAK